MEQPFTSIWVSEISDLEEEVVSAGSTHVFVLCHHGDLEGP